MSDAPIDSWNAFANWVENNPRTFIGSIITSIIGGIILLVIQMAQEVISSASPTQEKNRLKQIIGYFQRNRYRMQYDEYLL